METHQHRRRSKQTDGNGRPVFRSVWVMKRGENMKPDGLDYFLSLRCVNKTVNKPR